MSYRYIAIILITISVIGYISFLRVEVKRLKDKITMQEQIIDIKENNLSDAINELDSAKQLIDKNSKLCDDLLAYKNKISVEDNHEKLITKETSNNVIAFINLLVGLQ